MPPLLSRSAKIIVIIAGALIGIACVLIAAAWFLLPNPCENTVLGESFSPNGKIKAVVFNRSCGATAGFSTQVSLLRANESLSNNAGNVLVIDDDHGKAPAAPQGGPIVGVTWLSDTLLRMTHHPLVRVYKAESSFQGAKVEYVRAE